MAKTRLTNSTRSALLDWMMEKYDREHDQELEQQLKTVCEALNGPIRDKYPEKDMKVLRKYGKTDKFTAYTLHVPTDEGVRTTGLELNYELRDQAKELLKDAVSGPYTLTLTITEEQSRLFEQFSNWWNEAKTNRKTKRATYSTFLDTCKTLEDVLEVVTLPQELIQRYASGGALVVLNRETIFEIKKDFAA